MLPSGLFQAAGFHDCQGQDATFSEIKQWSLELSTQSRRLAAGLDMGGMSKSMSRLQSTKGRPFAAAGESIEAEVHEDSSEESASERKQRIQREYGFSDDVVDRYMLAFHGDESMAHRKMRATYVS